MGLNLDTAFFVLFCFVFQISLGMSFNFLRLQFKEFLISSALWSIVWASFIVIYCTLTLQPPIWENDINLWVTKFIIHCKIKGPQSRTIKTTITMVNIVFHQTPFTRDRTEVQKGRLSSDITFTWPFMSSRVADICLQCRRLGFDSCVGKIPWRRN